MSYNVSYFFDTYNSGYSGPFHSLCSLKSTSNLLYGHKSGTYMLEDIVYDYGIYSIQSDGTNFQVLVPNSTLQGYNLQGFSTFVSDGKHTLYAIAVDLTSGFNKTLVSFDTLTSNVTILKSAGQNVNLNIQTPRGALVIDTNNNILYGITVITKDGSNYYSIFSYVLGSSPTYNDSLYTFTSGTDGDPSGQLSISSDFTTLYGVSAQGSSTNPGYLYSINIANPIFISLITFKVTDINTPTGGLLLDNNTLYGTCQNGGSYTFGGIFIFNLNSNLLTSTIPFNQDIGIYTNGGLIKVNNNLYGMVNKLPYRENIPGPVWSYSLITNTFTLIHIFSKSPTDGYPCAEENGLALALDTVNSSSINILGTTWGGGNNIGSSGGSPGDGTIFKISIDNPPPGPIVCYVKGTKILTKDGYKPIEELKNGDYLLTKGKIINGNAILSSKYLLEPVIWNSSFKVGENNINKNSSPICLKQNSLGLNHPIRDLYVSPNHGICVRGKLVPTKYLINDKNIYQIKGLDSVEYYHVELDNHCIIIAEGVFTESYLNENTKHIFKEAPTLKIKKHNNYNDNDNLKRNTSFNVYKFAQLKR